MVYFSDNCGSLLFLFKTELYFMNFLSQPHGPLGLTLRWGRHKPGGVGSREIISAGVVAEGQGNKGSQ